MYVYVCVCVKFVSEAILSLGKFSAILKVCCGHQSLLACSQQDSFHPDPVDIQKDQKNAGKTRADEVRIKMRNTELERW